MEHPLISSLDSLTIEELTHKISELNKKMGIAMRMGNAHLCDQIRMALESYNAKYYEKSQAMYKAATQNSDTNLDDKIDIS
jgi:hypothetical protein